MFDESFWVAVAFVLFCALFGRRLWTFATGRLDRRGEAVRAELEQAVQLREEAQNLLAAHRRRERETAREAEEIVSRARDEAKRIVSAAQVRAAQEVVRRTRAADVRIARMQTRAAADARAAAAELVAAAAARAIAADMDEAADMALVDGAIAEIETRLSG